MSSANCDTVDLEVEVLTDLNAERFLTHSAHTSAQLYDAPCMNTKTSTQHKI